MPCLLDILIISAEVIYIRQDAQSRSPVLLVAQRDDACLARLLDPALTRRLSLELGDDTRIRAHQCLLHASSHHLSPILLHFLLGEGYHLSWLDKALSLLYLHLLMSHYLF